MHRMLSFVLTPLLSVALLGAGCGRTPAGEPCEPGDSVCHPSENRRLVCDDDGFSWVGEACPEGTECDQGQCVSGGCTPDTLRCDDNTVQWCDLTGSEWVDRRTCTADETCADGVCLADSCTPGEKQCALDALFICGADGESWERNECPAGTGCFFGECVECVNDSGCATGRICDHGSCITPDVEIVSERLPDAAVGSSYAARLEAARGAEPYRWAIADGALPPGINLAPATGALSGTPTETGAFPFTAEVTDDLDHSVQRELSITVLGEGLQITTPSDLPTAMEGFDYSTALQATGGVPPYAWMIVDGALPRELALFSAGRIEGIPNEIGSFPFTVRVFDNREQPATASKAMTLTVEIAPLEIIGDQSYNLLLIKIVVLDLLAPYIPYQDELQARGGLRPYRWAEKEIPPSIQNTLNGFTTNANPTWGLPDALSLANDGTVNGWMTDVSDAPSISIPFVDVNLTGYYFQAEVSDGQDPSEREEALFLIPTVPINR